MGHLWDALAHVYRVLGFKDATGGDEAFRQLVLARIIEPASKLGSLRVLEETGVAATSYRTRACRRFISARSRRRRRCRAVLLVLMPPGTVGSLSSVMGRCCFASALGRRATSGGS